VTSRQPDLFGAIQDSAPTDTEIKAHRRYGFWDAATGWHRLNPFRAGLAPALAVAYDAGFRQQRENDQAMFALDAAKIPAIS
jgi:hypothetical protein